MYISGTVVNGYGAASGTKQSCQKGSIELQFEYFERHDAAFRKKIHSCYCGTINVQTKLFVSVNTFIWDHMYQCVSWLPHSGWSEDLCFKKVLFSVGDSSCDGWIYFASKSPHRKVQNGIIEILAPYIHNIQRKQRCYIYLK